VTIGLLGMLSSGTGGCATASLLEMGDARAMALLPLTLTFDAIHLGILSAGSGRRSSAAAPPANPMVGWQDPDDWVGSCAGPLFCPDHKHFVCTGTPDACACECEVTLPPETAPPPAVAMVVR